MTPKQVKEAQEGGALVLDLREPHGYAAAHIPRSLNVLLEGVPVFGGYLIPYGRPLVLVADRQHEVDAAVRSLVRLGYEDTVGYLKKGMEAWIMSGYSVSSMSARTAQELRGRQLAGDDMLFVDVRDRREMEDGIIPGSKAIHMGRLLERSSELPADREIVLFCGSGNRSNAAASILRNSGIDNVGVMLGGLAAWIKNGYPMEPFKNG